MGQREREREQDEEEVDYLKQQKTPTARAQQGAAPRRDIQSPARSSPPDSTNLVQGLSVKDAARMPLLEPGSTHAHALPIPPVPSKPKRRQTANQHCSTPRLAQRGSKAPEDACRTAILCCGTTALLPPWDGAMSSLSECKTRVRASECAVPRQQCRFRQHACEMHVCRLACCPPSTTHPRPPPTPPPPPPQVYHSLSCPAGKGATATRCPRASWSPKHEGNVMQPLRYTNTTTANALASFKVRYGMVWHSLFGLCQASHVADGAPRCCPITCREPPDLLC